jgi:hypothetical protein
MANAIYPKWKEALEQASANSALTGTVKAVLLDLGVYSYNAAHDMYDDLTGVVGSPSPAFTTKTYVNGVFDADPITFTAVTGNSVEALGIFIDTGTPATSRLVYYGDTGITGLPVTPNGGDIIVTWDDGANKIFVL